MALPAIIGGGIWAYRAYKAYKIYKRAQKLKKMKEAADKAKKLKKLKEAAKKNKKDKKCPTGNCDKKKKKKKDEKAPPKISRQKQDRHVRGTKEYEQRVKSGKGSSSFKDRGTADRLTKEAWTKGKPVPGRPNVREHDFGRVIGRNSTGAGQTRVRVHNSGTGIHGHPSGPAVK